MSWVKFDDRFDDSDDIGQMSTDAIALHVCATTWSSRKRTDGFIPEGQVKRLPGGKAKALKELCAGDKPWWVKVDGGYQIRSYLKFNPSAEVSADRQEEISKIRAEAGRRGAEKRWQTDGKQDSKTNGKITDLPIANDGKKMAPYPVSRKEKETSLKRGKERESQEVVPAAWEEFCRVYPKRSGSLNKAESLRRHRKLFEGDRAQAVLDGAGRYAAWCQATGKAGTEFVAQMNTWLNQERWTEDYELPFESGPKTEVSAYQGAFEIIRNREANHATG